MFKIITGKCCVGQIVWDQFNYLRGFFSRQAIYLCQYGKQWHWAFSFEKCLIKTQMFSLHKPVPKLIFSCSFAYQGKGDIFANLGNRDAPFWNVLFPMGIARKGGGEGAESQKPRQRVSNADRKVFANPESFCDKFIIGWRISGYFAIQNIQIICKVSGWTGKFPDNLKSVWII